MLWLQRGSNPANVHLKERHSTPCSTNPCCPCKGVPISLSFVVAVVFRMDHGGFSLESPTRASTHCTPKVSRLT